MNRLFAHCYPFSSWLAITLRLEGTKKSFSWWKFGSSKFGSFTLFFPIIMVHGSVDCFTKNERKLHSLKLTAKTPENGWLEYWMDRCTHFPVNHDCGRKSTGFSLKAGLPDISISIKNSIGPNPNGPRSVNCDRAIRYSGLIRDPFNGS